MAQLNDTILGLVASLHADTLVPGLNLVQSVTVYDRNAGAYNVLTGERAVTEASVTCNAIIRRITARQAAQMNQGSGAFTIQANDIICTVEAADIAGLSVDVESQVQYDGKRYRVLDIKKKKLGADTLQYQFLMRA